ncbi:efflux RND transporter periplasmic adaptor subunit [Sphingomonas sp. LB-2]|uniref:efflux RND transporter periplasmic adaptor subunit n=1 Tax=Sphingomonas caeni TaxID=2984949 RepID=UPI00222E6A9E|nr:efflux RND transporter periplasmic adaptor subunit [Sphingomonas caeni]MCW3846008.1 efflux RND transporter periplasmic adaptor subunit [Sphingomonas caeni]
MLAALALAACGSADKALPPQSAAVQGERLTVVRAEIAQLKPLAAEIATRDQAEALVRIPGTLVELTVREGDEVRKGQLIGRVVDTRIAYETNALAAQVRAASAQADQARADLARAQYLYGKGVVAKARLDQAQAAARTADAQVKAAQAQMSASAESSRQGAILAPATGRILRADIPQGSVVAPGMSVATVTSGPPVLRIDVPQSLAKQLRVGTRFMIRDQAGLPDAAGTVTQLYPAASGGRVRAEAEMPQLATDLIGRRVSVLLDVGSRPGIVVPRRFVSTRYGVDYVDVAGKDGVTSMVVQTAPTGDPATVEILSGVVAGDVLVAGKAAR